MKRKYRDPLLGAALLCAGAALVLCPEASMEAGRQGLQLCGNVIVPALFPFFVLSSLVVELGMARYLGRVLERIMWPLFRVSGVGASALVLGFVGGYPVGARTAIGLYEKGLTDRTQTQRMLAFCNNSGPAFIFGVVGTGVFGSGKVGLLLYLAHTAASLCVGFLFRFYGKTDPAAPRSAPAPFHAVRFSTAFTASIRQAVAGVLNICAFVVFFTVAIRLLTLCSILDGLAGLLALLFAPLGMDRVWAARLLTGLVELSSGVLSLAGNGAPLGRVSMAAFMLGWAGLCVHCQVLSFLGDCGLSPAPYLVGKLLHGALSALFCAMLCRLFPFSQAASNALIRQAQTLAPLDAGSALVISIVAAWLLWLVFLVLTARALTRSKKRTGNVRRYGV